MFEEILIRPILNLLVIFYYLFHSVGVTGAFGWSIILLTVAIRFILYPLTHAQMKSMKKIADLKPHIDALSVKHGNDKKKLQEEQLRLYREAGVNPAAGCLPALLQIPVFIALYNVFIRLLNESDPNKIVEMVNSKLYPFLSGIRITDFSLDFFGISLAVKPNQWQELGVWLLLVPLITAFLQWYQTKLTIPNTKAVKKEVKEDDFAKAMQTQTTFVLPIMIGFFAYSFPLGLALYWNTFSIFAIIQQLKVNKK